MGAQCHRGRKLDWLLGCPQSVSVSAASLSAIESCDCPASLHGSKAPSKGPLHCSTKAMAVKDLLCSFMCV